MNKAIAWIVLVLGVYEILAILIDALPGVLVDSFWGWIIGIVLVILGAYLLKKK
tara:strand:- start:135 stop:296 length:162 start_codon:yes stop_codon:yes gene_type:complete